MPIVGTSSSHIRKKNKMADLVVFDWSTTVLAPVYGYPTSLLIDLKGINEMLLGVPLDSMVFESIQRIVVVIRVVQPWTLRIRHRKTTRMPWVVPAIDDAEEIAHSVWSWVCVLSCTPKHVDCCHVSKNKRRKNPELVIGWLLAVRGSESITGSLTPAIREQANSPV